MSKVKVRWTKEFKQFYARFYREVYYKENKQKIDKYSIKRNREVYKSKYTLKYQKRNKNIINMYQTLRNLAIKDDRF